MARILILLICTLIFINCSNKQSASEAAVENTTEVQANNQVTTESSQSLANLPSGSVTVDQAKEMLDSGNYQFIDLRTPEEIEATGMIPGATAMNMRDVDFKKRFQKLDGRIPIVFYCKSGGRSERAMSMADVFGFSKVYDLSAGMDGWAKKYETN